MGPSLAKQAGAHIGVVQSPEFPQQLARTLVPNRRQHDLDVDDQVAGQEGFNPRPREAGDDLMVTSARLILVFQSTPA